MTPAGTTPDGRTDPALADDALRVLCVDDREDAADALAAVAELLGHEARACYGGEAALAAFLAFRPDIVLLDLMMPGVGGLEVAARIRTQAGRRPLLLVATTALGSLEDRTATALAGFHFHLVKPVTLPTLRAAIDRFREVSARPAADSPGG
jgi:two-component system, OmpR family, response regulator